MKVIIRNSLSYPIQCIGAALSACEFDVEVWDGKGFFDMVVRKNPDLVLMDSNYIDPKYREANCKLVLYGDIFPFTDVDLIITEQDIDDKKFYRLNPAANLVQFGFGQIKDEYKTQLLYISDEQTPFYLIEILKRVADNYQLKIIGTQNIDLPEYLGEVSIKTMSDLIWSSRFVLSHNNRYSFDVLAGDSLPITTAINEYEIPHFSTYEELASILNDYPTSPYFDSAKQNYFVECEKILRHLDNHAAADYFIETAKPIIKRHEQHRDSL